MSGTSDPAFGGNWDLGEAITEHLISYPISHMIHESARESGIDMSNPTRSIVSLITSGFMSTVVGSFLGPFGALLGGLLGETIGLAGNYPGDKSKEERIAQKKARLALKIKAITTTLEITKDHVSNDTWNAIVDEYQRQLDSLGDSMGTEDEAFIIGERIVINSISRVDRNVYWNFEKIYNASKRELGLYSFF
jgi:hypothetical protein